jgi:hypothetical protein
VNLFARTQDGSELKSIEMKFHQSFVRYIIAFERSRRKNARSCGGPVVTQFFRSRYLRLATGITE